jgi:N-ethylmaleimide reductase
MTTNILHQFSREELSFKNRVFMAPMTRSRAPQQIPNAMMQEYYSQRASAGLIFSEGTQISPQGVGYIATPGIHTPEQIKGWQQITQAVHAEGGLIFCQLWHVGRASHPDFHNGELPVAPSAIPFSGKVFTEHGFKDVLTPRALTLDEIKAIVEDYKTAAQAAKLAGFDGVEIHGANGYLPAQFLEDGSNQRTDIYGGSLENRARFILEITDAAISVWGNERVSVRLSPRNPYNGMSDSNPAETYLYLIQQLEQRKLGILHFMEPAQLVGDEQALVTEVSKIFSGMLVLNTGYDKKSAEAVVADGIADAVSFGSLFVSNPDLPARFAQDASLAAIDRATLYGGEAQGYTDYAFL